jgi:hypothetical protein
MGSFYTVNRIKLREKIVALNFYRMDKQVIIMVG